MKNPKPTSTPVADIFLGYNYLFSKEEHGDGEEGGDNPQTIHDVDWADNDFIPLMGGLEFIRKFEIASLKWDRYIDHSGAFAWRLLVYFQDVPHTTVYGDDARLIMRAFELPEQPPSSE